MLRDARRLFRWQERQKQLTVELLQLLDGDSEDDHVERTLRLSASFLLEPVGDEPFSSGLVHFLAVMGIDSDGPAAYGDPLFVRTCWIRVLHESDCRRDAAAGRAQGLAGRRRA